MARRNDDTFNVMRDIFLMAPWWIGPVVAAVAYALIAYVATPLFARYPNMIIKTLASSGHLIATFAGIAVLIAWLAAMSTRLRSASLLNRQTHAESLKSVSWKEFEDLIGAAYRRQGYKVLDTGPGADGGIDLLLYRDGQETVVQCKQWRVRQVGVKPIRELYGILNTSKHKSARGVFVTIGDYTGEARMFAEENGIELIGQKQLVEMIQSVQRNEQRPAVTGPVTAESAPPACPTCGGEMVLRTAKRGANAGSQFWGCSEYPRCKGTRQA